VETFFCINLACTGQNGVIRRRKTFAVLHFSRGIYLVDLYVTVLTKCGAYLLCKCCCGSRSVFLSFYEPLTDLV